MTNWWSCWAGTIVFHWDILKAIAEKYNDFGILQIDAHCDLRKAYENFDFSHASIMYNALRDIPQITRLVQVGVRDFSEEEFNYIRNSNQPGDSLF